LVTNRYNQNCIRFQWYNALAPVLANLPLQKIAASLQWINPVNAVFDADPTVKPQALQFRENGIVVVQPLSNLAMPQTGCISMATRFFPAQVLQRPTKR
jgi:hypothetical protein